MKIKKLPILHFDGRAAVIAGNPVSLVLLGVGLGVTALALIIIITVVIIKRKKSPDSKVAKTEGSKTAEDYTELSTSKPSHYAKVTAEQTGKGADEYEEVSSSSTNTAHYETALNADSSDLDRTYTTISNYMNS